VIEFYPNWKEDEWIEFKDRYYDMQRIEFTATEVSMWESGKSSKQKLRYLYEHPTEFSNVMKSMLQEINDDEPFEEGQQPMPFYVTVYKPK